MATDFFFRMRDLLILHTTKIQTQIHEIQNHVLAKIYRSGRDVGQIKL